MPRSDDHLTIFSLPIHDGVDAWDGYDHWRPVVGQDAPHYRDRRSERFVGKRWGGEEVIVNSREYCGKILTVHSGMKTSYHYHPVKDETFHVLGGIAVLYFGTRDALGGIVVLQTGEKFRMGPGVCHCIACPNGTADLRLIEFSTQDNPDDSIRVQFPTI